VVCVAVADDYRADAAPGDACAEIQSARWYVTHVKHLDNVFPFLARLMKY
jgi:hypothetical protein